MVRNEKKKTIRTKNVLNIQGIVSMVPKSFDSRATGISKGFGLQKKEVFKILEDDSEIIDIKKKRLKKTELIDITFRKRFVRRL